MNLGAIRTAVLRRLPADYDTTALADLINNAVHYVEVLEDWPWQEAKTTFSTSAGTDTYTPAVASGDVWLRTTELLVTSGGITAPLVRQPVRYLDDRWASNIQGIPVEWAVTGDQIVFRPTPDGVYTITHRYIKAQPDLSADSDSPLSPAVFHGIYVEHALSSAYRRLGLVDEAQMAEKAVRDWTARMIDNRRRWKGPGKVRVRPGGWL